MASKLLLSSVSIHVCLFAYVYVYLSVSFLPISVCLWLWTSFHLSFFHSLISFQTVSTHTIHISAWCFLIAMFLLPHAISLDYTHFTCGPSLLVFLFLSVSLMEHLPAHTFLRSCPLLTHLSIHTCLSACVCVFVSVSLHRQGKDSLPCKHTCQTSLQPSTVCLCMCVGVKHHARRSRQMRRKLFLQ